MNTDRLLCGPSAETLKGVKDQSVQLMFTSPPYFNARPQYSIYESYQEYLESVKSVLSEVWRVLEDGRFAVVNSSPVLVSRLKRSLSSQRIPVPFDLHRLMMDLGFEFVDDIIWKKPEGAGWASGRGRRFSADRSPLQYKAVPVTEYVMVYRKPSGKLIDWHIRNHDPDLVEKSRISDGYEVTNVWEICPARSKQHPAIFPDGLAERVIRYYSFEGDTVLDPYAGIGTTGRVAQSLNRNFLLGEMNDEYVRVIQESEWYQRRNPIRRNVLRKLPKPP